MQKMKKILLMHFSLIIFTVLHAQSYDPICFGMSLKDVPDNFSYRDFMYGGYREAEFEKTAKKYLLQDLNEAALVNSGVFMLNAQKDDILLILKKQDEPDIDLNLNTDAKKAFLMAVVRLNLRSVHNLYQNIDMGKSLVLMFDLNRLYHDTIFKYSQDDQMKFFGSHTSINQMRMFFREKNYMTEIHEVLKVIENGKARNFINEKVFAEVSDKDFIDHIAKDYHSLNYNQLIEMFNFVQASWDQPLSVEGSEGNREFRAKISMERSNAFLMALSRMRITVTHLYPISVIVPGENISTERMSGWTYGFVCNFPAIGKYKFLIQNDARGVVWVKSLDVEGDTRDRLIPNGKYYSPELYNVVLSIFGELARKDFQKSTAEKQEAKAE